MAGLLFNTQHLLAPQRPKGVVYMHFYVCSPTIVRRYTPHDVCRVCAYVSCVLAFPYAGISINYETMANPTTLNAFSSSANRT